MPTNLDLSGQTSPATLGFSQNGAAVRAVYSIGGGPNTTIDDVGDVIGTNNGDQVSFGVSPGNIFHLSRFTGGSGADTLSISGRGAYDLAGVTGVETFTLANTGVVMPDSVFTDVAGGRISVNLSSGTLTGGQSLNASGVAAGHNLFVNVNLTSYIPITGGAGDDVFVGNLLAGGGETLHGGLGRDAAFITGGTQFGSLASPVNLANIDGVEFFQFDNSQANFARVRDVNFVGVTGVIGIALGQLGGLLDGSALSAGNAVDLIGSGATDTLKGGAAADTFQFGVGQLTAADTVTGGAGVDTLIVEGGATSLAGVSGVEFLTVRGGASVSVTDANFAGVTGFLGANTVAGGSVDGSAVGAGHALFLIGSTSTETLIGGAGDDIFQFGAGDLSASDVLNGGAGNDQLLFTSSGVLNIAGVSGVENFVLDGGGANTLVISNANVAGLATASVTAGGGGALIDASGVTTTGTQLYLFGGGGNDVLRGGAEVDVLVSGGGNDTLFGGGGADGFALASSGIATVQDFQSGTDLLFFSDALFDLGANEGGPAAFDRLDAGVFSTAAGGAFTTAQQRFAFDAVSHQLYYAPQGSASAAADVHAIAVLLGVGALSASDFFYGH